MIGVGAPKPAASQRSDADGSGARAALIGVLLLTLVHAIWLQGRIAPAYASADAPGYYVQARLIVETGDACLRPESPVQYLNVHFLQSDGIYCSRYTPGLAWLLAPAYALGGPSAALRLSPLLHSLGILVLFAVARVGLRPGAAAAAALLYAFSPTPNFYAIHGDSHTAATACLLTGLLALLRWHARPTALGGALAAFAYAAAVTVRPLEITASTGAAAILGLALRERRLRVAHGIAMGLGAALPLGALAWHGQVHFGAPWRTGYSLTDESVAFSGAYFRENALHYAELLMSAENLPLLLPGLAGIGLLVRAQATRALGVGLLGSVVPLSLAYTAYYYRYEGSERFFLPIFGPVLIGVCGLFDRLGRFDRRSAGLALAFVCAGLLPVQAALTRWKLLPEIHGHRVAARVYEAVEETVPAGSILLAETRVADALDFSGRWQLADRDLFYRPLPIFGPVPTLDDSLLWFWRETSTSPSLLALVTGLSAAEGQARAEQAAPVERPDWIQRGRRSDRIAAYAELTLAQRHAQVIEDLRRWAAGRPIYVITTAWHEVEGLSEALSGSARLETVAGIDWPAPPPLRVHRSINARRPEHDIHQQFRIPDRDGRLEIHRWVDLPQSPSPE